MYLFAIIIFVDSGQNEFATVKIESGDIHTYLETFNKEIENGEQSIIAGLLISLKYTH